MKSALVLLLLCCTSLVSLVHSHSFVTCTDFRPSSVAIPDVDTNPGVCKGYPRRYFFRDQQGDGYTFRPGQGQPACDPVKQFRASDIVSAYSSKYPMASYKPGSDVCIQWPARNHAKIFNGIYLNSGNNLVFMSPTANMNRDPTQTEFNQGLVAEMSFSDCAADDPALSAGDNSNRRPCRGCFKLPANLPTGIYSFEWWWEFNVGEFYSTCWDAEVSNSATAYVKNFQTKPADDPTTFQRSGPPPDFTKGGTREPIKVHPLFSGAPTSAPPPTSAPTSAPTSGPTSGPTSAPTQGPTSAPTQAPTQAPTSAPGTGSGKAWKFNIVSQWPGGFQATLDIDLQSAVNGWVVVFDLPGASVVNLWNGVLVTGSSPNTVNAPDWNKNIAAGGKISLGMVLSGSAQSKPTFVTLNNAAIGGSTPTSAPTSAPSSGPTSAPTQGPTSAPTTVPTGTPGCSHTSLKFTSKNGRLYVNDIPFDLKGTNWFGFETDIYVPHGCWTFSSGAECFNYIFDFLKKNKFNAVRIPVTVDQVLNNPTVNSFPFTNVKSLDVLDNLIDAAAAKGILVMLDIHRLQHALGISELWYDATWTMAKVKQSITDLATRYSSKWNVFALDLKNEPHGKATWGDGNVDTDFRLAAEDMAKHLIDLNLNKWLIFVEGVERSPASTYNCYWGENLVGVRNNPIRISDPERLVYSPHAYGPSVFRQPFHPPTATNFPGNLDAIWDYKFGYIKDLTGRAVVLGEWGGFYTDDDKRYQDQMALYMISRGMRSNFYWCLNPNSGDTGGLLANDWRTAVTSKLNLLNNILPNPTVVTKSGANYCIQNTQAVEEGVVDIVDQSAKIEFEVVYKITWESEAEKSFGGEITLKTASGVSDWKISFNYPEGQTIQTVTNAKVISAGPDVVLGPSETNNVIVAGGSVSIPFVAKFSTLNNSPYTFGVSTGENAPVAASSFLIEKDQNTPSGPPSDSASTLAFSSTLTIFSVFIFFFLI